MLLQNTEYRNGFSADHPAVRMFWSVFHQDLTLEEKKKFLCKNYCETLLVFANWHKIAVFKVMSMSKHIIRLV